MDILLFNSEPLDIEFYWLEKNRTFVLQKKDFKKNDDISYHPLKAILDGSYSLVIKPKSINLTFGIRVGEDIIYKETGQKIYFKIDTKPSNKITKIEKDIFTKAETKLKIGVGRSARKLWNLYWFNLHYLSYNYPENPTGDQMKQIEELTIKMTKDGLGCPRCKAHFIQWNKSNPIQQNYSSKDSLIKWYLDLHNDVNKRNKKKLFTRQQADNTYQNFKFKNMVDDYKVNIIELFENKKLATFPDLINKDIKRRLWKENNVFEEYWIKDDN